MNSPPRLHVHEEPEGNDRDGPDPISAHPGLWTEKLEQLAIYLVGAAATSASVQGRLPALKAELLAMESDAASTPLAGALRRLVLLTEVGECLPTEDDRSLDSFVDFMLEAMGRLGQGLLNRAQDEDRAGASLVQECEWIRQHSDSQWGQYLDLLVATDASSGFAESPTQSRPTDADPWLLEDLDPSQSFNDPEIEDLEQQSAPEPSSKDDAVRLSRLLQLLGLPATATPPEQSAAPHTSSTQRDEAEPRDLNTLSELSRTKAGTPESSQQDHGFARPRDESRLESELVIDPSLRDDFLFECEELCERIQDQLDRLSSGLPHEEALRELRRVLHTFKGAAGSVGLADLAALIHELESQIEVSQGPVTKSLLDSLHESMLHFETLLTAIRRGEPPPRSPDRLWNRLAAIGTEDEDSSSAHQAEPSPEASENPERQAFPPGESDFVSSGSTANAVNEPILESQIVTTPNLGVQAFAPTAEADGSIRVTSEQIEVMMDLVAELLMRRGFLEAQAGEMRMLSDSARICRNRMHADIDRLRDLTFEPLGKGGTGRQLTSSVPVLEPLAVEQGVGESSSFGGGLGATARRGPGVGELEGIVRRLSEQAEDVAVLAEHTRGSVIPLADDGDALARLSHKLWETLQSIRIVPIRGLLQRLVRVARETARFENRQIDVSLVGEETGVDRLVMDKAYELLLHIVRNAVGHGIETTDERRRAGKSPVGRVTLEARREGNTIVIKVQDDGRGLDYSAIETKAKTLGLIARDANPTTEQLNAIVFMSGFSTRASANAISGRGVGMDVVAQGVSKLQGSVSLNSLPGEGTTLTLRLPARHALEKAMVVRIDGQPFALPISTIESVQNFDPVEETTVHGRPAVRVRDRCIPLLAARQALALEFGSTPPSLDPKLLIVESEGAPLAILVDAIEGPRELVIKPLSALLAGHPGLSGTGLTVTGEVIFMLDPSSLVRRLNALGTWKPRTDSRSPRTLSRTILVVDDSLSVRRVAARHLRRLGLVVEEVSNGVEALRKLRDRPYRLVLTDLEMPRMDGFELLSELKRSGVLERTPVVVASTRIDPETRQRVLHLGASSYVTKPIEAEDWKTVIEPLLQLEDRTSGVIEHQSPVRSTHPPFSTPEGGPRSPAESAKAARCGPMISATASNPGTGGSADPRNDTPSDSSTARRSNRDRSAVPDDSMAASASINADRRHT